MPNLGFLQPLRAPNTLKVVINSPSQHQVCVFLHTFGVEEEKKRNQKRKKKYIFSMEEGEHYLKV